MKRQSWRGLADDVHMGFKMAPSESAKVALGVLALAGIGLIVYVISKQLRKKSKTDANIKSQKEEASPLLTKEKSGEETEPKSIQGRESDDGVGKGEKLSSAVSTAKSDDGSQDTKVSESASAVSMETPFSTSTSGWEDVRPMESSFVEVKSPPQGTGDPAAEMVMAGKMATSQTGPDSLGSFTEVSHGEDSDDQGRRGDSAVVTSGQSNIQSREAGEAGLQVQGAEGDVTVPTLPAHKEVKAVADDVQSLQSEDTSSGEAPSFEQINGSDDGTSLGESGGAERGEHPPEFSFGLQQPSMTESLPSFEKVSMGDAGLKSGDLLSSGLMSVKSTNSSIVVIPESLDGNLTSQQVTEEEKEVAQIETGAQQQTERAAETEGSSEKTAHSTESGQEVEETLSSETDSGKTETQTPQTSEAGGAESLPSFEVIQERGLGEVKEYYSSESLQSFATAVSGSSSSKQDFYSPVSSPPTFDSSLNNTSFKSFDDSTSYDTEASEDMTFYDVEASGRLTPQSPQDHTPTNTPVPPELGGGDAESAKTPVGETSGKVMESSVIDESGQMKMEEKEKADPTTQQTLETSPAVKPNGEEAPVRPLLNIDTDKITEAIIMAQNNPGKLAIGHVQVLVELLKRDDWTLLNTTLQCLMRATAFTVNVEVLRVVAGPQELSRLLQKLAPQVPTGGSKRGGQGQSMIEGGPDGETLFLNCCRVVNNVAMDIKSHSQLEGSIPALTDLLMTEGISETVTLACLQPLTNLAISKTYHGQYTRLLQQLYSFLDTSQSRTLRLQCLKLLVNLSLNADMVPHMLAAKAPSCLLDLLDINYDVDLLLRTVTFLANVMTIMQERGLSPSNLPPDEKAPSPETLLSALSSVDRRDTLRNKVYRLTRHDSPDVCYQASRLYKFVVTSSATK